MKSEHSTSIHWLWKNIAVLAAIACFSTLNSATAQTNPDEVDAKFEEYVQSGMDVDEARDALIDEYDVATATASAVWTCYEDTDLCSDAWAGDEYSSVIDAWSLFMYLTEEEGMSASESVEILDDLEEFDPYLTDAVALWWCIPESGEGCEGDPYEWIWDEFERLDEEDDIDMTAFYTDLIDVHGPIPAELASSFWCGHATCFAGVEIDESGEVEEQPAPPVPPAPNVTTDRGEGDNANRRKKKEETTSSDKNKDVFKMATSRGRALRDKATGNN